MLPGPSWNSVLKPGVMFSTIRSRWRSSNFAQNKVAEAMKALQSLADTAPSPDKKVAAQLKLAEMYVSKANVAAAEPLISEIFAKDRRNAGASRLRAAINIEKGQIDSAISDLREALNDQPKSPELLMLLALAYERGGKNELADRQYADALRSSGSNADVALRYAAFLQRSGDATRAEQILNGCFQPQSEQFTGLVVIRPNQTWPSELDGCSGYRRYDRPVNDGRGLAVSTFAPRRLPVRIRSTRALQRLRTPAKPHRTRFSPLSRLLRRMFGRARQTKPSCYRR